MHIEVRSAEMALRAGCRYRIGCRRGLCDVGKVQLVFGEVRHEGSEPDPLILAPGLSAMRAMSRIRPLTWAFAVPWHPVDVVVSRHFSLKSAG